MFTHKPFLCSAALPRSRAAAGESGGPAVHCDGHPEGRRILLRHHPVWATRQAWAVRGTWPHSTGDSAAGDPIRTRPASLQVCSKALAPVTYCHLGSGYRGYLGIMLSVHYPKIFIPFFLPCFLFYIPSLFVVLFSFNKWFIYCSAFCITTNTIKCSFVNIILKINTKGIIILKFVIDSINFIWTLICFNCILYIPKTSMFIMTLHMSVQ